MKKHSNNRVGKQLGSLRPICVHLFACQVQNWSYLITVFLSDLILDIQSQTLADPTVMMDEIINPPSFCDLLFFQLCFSFTPMFLAVFSFELPSISTIKQGFNVLF